MRYELLNRDSATRFIPRLRRIESPTQRRWGKLDPAPLLAHLTRGIEIALGEVPIADRSNLFTRTVLRWLIFDSPLPWPKGVKAPPVFFPQPQGDLAAERARLEAAMERFVDALEKRPTELHMSELFGPLPLTYWSKINGRHTEHHLQQYGV